MVACNYNLLRIYRVTMSNMHRKLHIQLLAVLPLFLGMLIMLLISANIFNTILEERLEVLRGYLTQHIKYELKGRVDTAYSITQNCYSSGYEEAVCLALMENISFDSDNYIWVHRLYTDKLDSGSLLVHPNKEIIGKDPKNFIAFNEVDKMYVEGEILSKNQYKGSPAVNVFHLFNEVAVKSGRGFVSYFWPKNIAGKVSDVAYPKTSYVRYFEPFSWVLGAGEYEDIVDDMLAKEKDEFLAVRNQFFALILTGISLTTLFLVIMTGIISRKVTANYNKYEKQLINSAEQLRVSEKRLFDIASSSGDIIWEIDNEYTYNFVAGIPEKIIGYSARQMIGMSFFYNVPEQSRQTFEQKITSLKHSGQAIKDVEQKFCSRDKRDVFLHINGLPVYDTDGKIVGYRGVFRDITDSKREESERKILEMELQHAQKMEAVGTLSAGIAHEINTPLQFIGDNLIFSEENGAELFTFVDEVIRRAGEENHEHFISVIKEIEEKYDIDFLREELPKATSESLTGIEQIRKIVKAMKDFSHQDSSEKELADINEALQQTVILSRNEWKYSAEINTQFDDTLPKVNCYLGELKQVFLNLIVNASHAINDRYAGQQIRQGLIILRTFSKDHRVFIQVEDNGGGIPDNIKERVFDPFFTTKEVGKGSGQGLAISYKIIHDKHGGKISLHSTVGSGTTFTIELPV